MRAIRIGNSKIIVALFVFFYITYIVFAYYPDAIITHITGVITIIACLLDARCFIRNVKYIKVISTLKQFILIVGSVGMSLAYAAYIFIGVSPSSNNFLLSHLGSSLTFDNFTTLLILGRLILFDALGRVILSKEKQPYE